MVNPYWRMARDGHSCEIAIVKDEDEEVIGTKILVYTEGIGIPLAPDMQVAIIGSPRMVYITNVGEDNLQASATGFVTYYKSLPVVPSIPELPFVEIVELALKGE